MHKSDVKAELHAVVDAHDEKHEEKRQAEAEDTHELRSEGPVHEVDETDIVIPSRVPGRPPRTVHRKRTIDTGPKVDEMQKQRASEARAASRETATVDAKVAEKTVEHTETKPSAGLWFWATIVAIVVALGVVFVLKGAMIWR